MFKDKYTKLHKGLSKSQTLEMPTTAIHEQMDGQTQMLRRRKGKQVREVIRETTVVMATARGRSIDWAL